ncbi:hypothetical protein MCOR25_003623 [Pyricularia grisea]|nr:hypothetical protein MCOR25_003623 [Pyricularia grisea]
MPPSTADAAAGMDTGSVDGDAGSSPLSLHCAVHARRDEYIQQHKMRIKIGTWNVAGLQGTDKDLATWFVHGKGVDRRLATLDVARNPAIERQETADSLDDDPNAVRLVGGDKIGLYVLGLQEVVDLNVASQYMRGVYSSSESLSAMDRWKMALEAALPSGYTLIASEQMTGLLLLIYASAEVAPTISNVSTSAVGTGLLGYMGNKGSVAARIVVGEATRMTFVNCHLASGHESTNLERRLWDVGQILSRTQFPPVPLHPGAGGEGGSPEKIGDEDFAFWFGDLNFRLDLPGQDIRRLLLLHTRGEYDVSQKPKGKEDTALDGEEAIVLRTSDSSDDKTETSSNRTGSSVDGQTDRDDDSISLPDPDDFLPDPSDDPASLQATLDSLLPHDQLGKLIKDGKVFQEGWREGPITFLPSYKYDVNTVGLFDSSDKKRAPSWCDRILYRSKKDREAYQKKVRDAEESRRRDEELKSRGIGEGTEDDEVLFDYDPENDGDDQPTKSTDTNSNSNNSSNTNVFDYDEYDENEDADGAEDASEDRIHLDIYTSHQRIQSSDHKPVISVFDINYDAAVPELKANVYADAARELDRAENESRPVITVVVEKTDRGDSYIDGTDAGEAAAINFGDVYYLRKKTSSMTIANTGRVAAKFSFVERPSSDQDPLGVGNSQWLTTSFLRTDLGPQAGDNEAVDLGKEVTLEPGETVKAVIGISVDHINLVTHLNDGQASLEEVLILRVEQGRDHFIPVRAHWMVTCIGRSIEELIRVPDGGIRAFVEELSAKKKADGASGSKRVGSIPYDCEVRCAAPKELFKLTEAVETLAERVLADEQMLETEVPRNKGAWPFSDAQPSLESRDPRLVAAVIDHLDQDKAVAEAFEPEVDSMKRLEVVAEVLLIFLQSLTDGIVTISLWAQLEQASIPSLTSSGNTATTAAKQMQEEDKATVLDVLAAAPNHNISFVFLTTTLAKVIAELTPLTKAETALIRTATSSSSGSTASSMSGISPLALTRRSLSFRRGPVAGQGAAEALAALEKRQAKERQVAEVLARVGKVCRAPVMTKAKEIRAVEDKQRALLELFLRRELYGPD